MPEDLIETVACPNCDSSRFDVVYPASYPKDLTREKVLEVYSASSSHQLFDAVVQCSECTLAYLNPRFRQDLILESYASAVDPVFVKQNELRVRTFRRSLEFLGRRGILRLAPETRILDVGCAGGAFPKAAKDAGLSVVGVEPSRWLSEYGRKTYGVDVRTGFLSDHAFETGSFDAVSLWDVIEHLPDAGAVLDEIRRILKSKGTLIVNYPDYDSFARKLLGRRWPMFLSVHLTYFTPATLRALLEKHGFEVREVHPFWQTLELGYSLQRAADYFRVFGWLARGVRALGLGSVPLRYNIGQSLLIATRAD